MRQPCCYWMTSSSYRLSIGMPIEKIYTRKESWSVLSNKCLWKDLRFVLSHNEENTRYSQEKNDALGWIQGWLQATVIQNSPLRMLVIRFDLLKLSFDMDTSLRQCKVESEGFTFVSLSQSKDKMWDEGSQVWSVAMEFLASQSKHAWLHRWIEPVEKQWNGYLEILFHLLMGRCYCLLSVREKLFLS